MDIKYYIKNKKGIIDKALERYLPSKNVKPAMIHKAMRYAVFTGGKRIRPILVIAGFEACGGKGSKILPIACAIELIHTYTLIHDDLPCMDNDDYRRGELTCHKKFNESIALLAGDALLTLGFQLLSEAGTIDIISEVSKAIGSLGTIGGQVVDIRDKGQGTKANKIDLDYIASHKTGALFEVAVKTGGIFKKVKKSKLDALSNFGKYIGLTFQLIDDLLDKDGYVKIYGEAHTRKMAALLTDRAKHHLGIFGNKSKRLQEIADLVLERDY